MANKRELKQFINAICEELLAETLAVGMFEKNVNNQDVDNLLKSIVEYNNDYIRRISHPQPGMKPKLYYRNVIDSFNNSVEETIEIIKNLY